jgi:hypothetical protein
MVDASPAVQDPVLWSASQNAHSICRWRSTIARCRSVPRAGIAPLGMGAGPDSAATESSAAPIRKPVPPRAAITVTLGVVDPSTQ